MEGQKDTGKPTPLKDDSLKATLEVSPTIKSTPQHNALPVSTAAYSSGSKIRSPRSPAVAQAAGAKGASPFFTSPDSESRPKKSVKHLECAYHFGGSGCKWSAETCLYSHHHTGNRAGTPVHVEPGRPPVAGKNATNPHPEYHNWRNSAHEGGIEYTPGPVKSSPHIAARPEVSLPLRQQIEHIHTKAQSHGYHLPLRPHNQPPPRSLNQSQNRPPIQPATPIMGQFNYNVDVQPFSSAHRKVEEANRPGPSMTSPAGSPRMAVPVNPANTPASHPGTHMVNTPINIADPYYGAHPQPYIQHGAYYLAPPPAGPGPQEYEAALQHYQRELESMQQELSSRTTENTALRKELTKSQTELQAKTELATKLRMVSDAAIDTVLTLDYHSQAVVVRFRQMCRDKASESLKVMNELNEFVYNMKPGGMRTDVSKMRDQIIVINKTHLDGLDNGLGHHEECRRLRTWFCDQIIQAKDQEAYDHFFDGVAKSGYKWHQFLK